MREWSVSCRIAKDPVVTFSPRPPHMPVQGRFHCSLKNFSARNFPSQRIRYISSISCIPLSCSTFSFSLLPSKQGIIHHSSSLLHQSGGEHIPQQFNTHTHTCTMSSETPMQTSSKKTKEPQQTPILHVLSWARHVSGLCLQQLARPATAGPLLFTCICLTLAYKNRKKWGHKEAAPAARPVLHRSVSMATLHGGKVALQRLIDSQEARIDQPALENAARTLKSLLNEEQLSFNLLQRTAAKLEMSGKENEAVEMLREAWEKAERDGKTHEAYELEMLLVEMLIYKGDYQEALKRKCLTDIEISDARGRLYQAVIYLIEGKIDQAKQCYQEFQDIQERFHYRDAIKEGSPLYGLVHDFQVFERIVINLKKEIELAHITKKSLPG